VLHWETLKQDEAGFRAVMAKLVTLARSNVRDGILVRWLWALGTGWRFLGKSAKRLARSRTGRLIHAYRSKPKYSTSRALRADGLSTLLDGILNSFPYTCYAENIGLVLLTRSLVLSR
jgi:permease family protein